MDGEGRKAADTNIPTRAIAQDARAHPNILESHLVRKYGDIGHQRAVCPGIDTIQCELRSRFPS